MKDTIYYDNGSIKDSSPKNGKKYTIEELQAIVEGDIELAYDGFGRQMMVLNENPDRSQTHVNVNAMNILASWNIYAVPFGTVLVCSQNVID